MDIWGDAKKAGIFYGWEILIRDLADDLGELVVPEAHMLILDRQTWDTDHRPRWKRLEHLSYVWTGETIAV